MGFERIVPVAQIGEIVAFIQLIRGVEMKTTMKLCLGFVPVFTLIACSTGPKYPPAPAATTVEMRDYVIGPGDQINLIVWRNPELSGAVPVRPDGKMTTPLVEDLVAAGKTPSQLARDSEKALAKYIQDPVVTVIVTSFVGPFSEQIRVIGQAARPQSLPYREKMTLMDVMIAVGGVTEFAAGNRASILRTSEGNQQYSVRLEDLLRDGDLSANVEMRPGDVLVIPEGFF
jgi:polysaccharide export outer membrane protein